MGLVLDDPSERTLCPATARRFRPAAAFGMEMGEKPNFIWNLEKAELLIRELWMTITFLLITLAMRVQDRLNVFLKGDEQRGIPPDATSANVQYQRIMREESQEDDEPQYGGGNARPVRTAAAAPRPALVSSC
jgi:hypothetical protein